MGICEQPDTGQVHPDKDTGQRTDDNLQIHVFSALEWPYSLAKAQNARYVRDAK